MRVNIDKFDRELREAGIPIHGVRGDGVIDFQDDATDEQRKRAEEILQAHDPSPEINSLRLQAYRTTFSMDEFMEAYFEATYEGKTEKMDDLQSRRVSVKAQFPKI